jgi:hypothetical protein
MPFVLPPSIKSTVNNSHNEEPFPVPVFKVTHTRSSTSALDVILEEQRNLYREKASNPKVAKVKRDKTVTVAKFLDEKTKRFPWSRRSSQKKSMVTPDVPKQKPPISKPNNPMTNNKKSTNSKHEENNPSPVSVDTFSDANADTTKPSSPDIPDTKDALEANEGLSRVTTGTVRDIISVATYDAKHMDILEARKMLLRKNAQRKRSIEESKTEPLIQLDFDKSAELLRAKLQDKDIWKNLTGKSAEEVMDAMDRQGGAGFEKVEEVIESVIDNSCRILSKCRPTGFCMPSRRENAPPMLELVFSRSNLSTGSTVSR